VISDSSKEEKISFVSGYYLNFTCLSENFYLKFRKMEKHRGSSPEKPMVIRYNVFYTAGIFTVAIIMLGLFLTVREKGWFNSFFLILSVLLFIRGIYALLRSKYVRLDNQTKTVKVYDTPIFWARKYKYDRLLFNDGKIYREIDGKTEYINIIRHQCRKDDFEAFIREINKGD
jgi:hypothetical protein